MCGITGVLGRSDAAPRLLQSLQRLEYRGYDSAGVATIHNGLLHRRRALGKLRNLIDLVDAEPMDGHCGIGHTRWATHGAPSVRNAHPHATENVAVVHNGIIENFRELKAELEALGHVFESDTDTEVIAQLVSTFRAQGKSPEASLEASLSRLHGAFALAVMFRGADNLLIGARRGSPLVVGHGDGEMFLGSDAIALSMFTNRISFMDEGDWVVLSHDGADIRDSHNQRAQRDIKVTSVSPAMVSKGNHRHYMAKEIHEQPDAIGRTASFFVDAINEAVTLPEGVNFKELRSLTVSACGTAYYAGWVARYWFEQLARLPVEVDIASEFRYREPVLDKKGMALFISQSGETADTLAALRYCKAGGMPTVGIVNVPESSIAREADRVVPTFAGPEIGVASTKAFTCQLSVLMAMAIAAGKERGVLSRDREVAAIRAVLEAPGAMAQVLNDTSQYESLGQELAKARTVLFQGRGSAYPIALEGALKLKEISYIHAEGYAAGELKHGPIALVDDTVPVITIAPSGPLFEKNASNMQEVAARGGKVVLISDAEGIKAAGDAAWRTLEVPKADPIITPLLYVLPVQLLAYYTAVAKGTDVDQPRNLAKSVTVE